MQIMQINYYYYYYYYCYYLPNTVLRYVEWRYMVEYHSVGC